MFEKRRKPEVEEVETKTEIIESDTQEEKDYEMPEKFAVEAPKPPQQPVENAIPDRYKYYIEKYHKSFSPQDFIMPDQAEMHSLMFGILMELKEIKEAIRGK